jgi:hypothetical protein
VSRARPVTSGRPAGAATPAPTSFDTRRLACIVAHNRCTLVSRRTAEHLAKAGLLEHSQYVETHSLGLVEYNPALTSTEHDRFEHALRPTPQGRRLYTEVYRAAWARVDAALAAGG